MLLASPVFIPYITSTKCKNQGQILILKLIIVGLISNISCKFDHFSSLLTMIANLAINMICAECLINPPSHDAGRHWLLGPQFKSGKEHKSTDA